MVDNLTYYYNGNQLMRVSDSVEDPSYVGAFNFKDGANTGAEYAYDANGNMVIDYNKGITSITYNTINMPQKITFSDGKTTEYVYSYDGTKLQTKHTTPIPQTSTTTTYSGNLIYENGALKRLLVDGGYVTFNGTTPKYHFYIQDHLGNNRVVADEDGNIEQINHYYPFGGLMADISTNSDAQTYKYNGKELDRMHGLDTYDYGARQHNAATGRWDRMDQKCEKYYDVSPYVYCLNNPVNAMDPDGKEVVIWYKNKQGQDCQFVFTGFHGKNFIIYPKNQFIKDFLQAYMHNVKNGGGNMMKEAVLNKKYRIYVDDAANLAEPETNFSPGRQPTIHWESRKGLKTSHGGKQSPATRLEHEFDHAVDNINNSLNHRIKREQKDKQYGNKEEKRVITGSESKTAKANKEDIRDDHFGKVYDVSDPTKIY